MATIEVAGKVLSCESHHIMVTQHPRTVQVELGCNATITFSIEEWMKIFQAFGEIPPEDPVRTCHVCGCTDDNACHAADGTTCYWVAEDLCSECIMKVNKVIQ